MDCNARGNMLVMCACVGVMLMIGVACCVVQCVYDEYDIICVCMIGGLCIMCVVG